MKLLKNQLKMLLLSYVVILTVFAFCGALETITDWPMLLLSGLQIMVMLVLSRYSCSYSHSFLYKRYIYSLHELGLALFV